MGWNGLKRVGCNDEFATLRYCIEPYLSNCLEGSPTNVDVYAEVDGNSPFLVGVRVDVMTESPSCVHNVSVVARLS